MKKIDYKLLKRNKIILENFSYLSILQILTIGAPIIALPYLIRILGADRYGAVIFAQTIVSYLIILINYGFDIYGSKEIAKIKDDKVELSKITSSILISKLLIGIVVFIIYFIVLQFISLSYYEMLLYYFSTTIAISEILVPSWYFQGIEKMKYITLIVGISKLIYLVFVFVFIRSAESFYIVPLLIGIPGSIAGIIGIYIVFIHHRIKFQLASWHDIYNVISEGFSYFMAKTASKLRDSSNVVLIGIFFTNTYVAYYDLANKIVSLFIVIYQNIPTVILPRLAITKDSNFARKIFKLSIIVSVLCIFLVLISSNTLISIFGGKELLNAVPYLRLLSIFFLLYSVNTLTSYFLIINDLQKDVYRSIVFSLLIYGLLLTSLFFVKSITLIISIFLFATFIDFSYKVIVLKRNNLIHWLYVHEKRNQKVY